MEKENSFHTSFDNIQHNNIPFIAQIITKAKACCCDRTWPRIAGILMNIINQNKEALKKECYIGLPDDLPCLRALVWKINFIPSRLIYKTSLSSIIVFLLSILI